MPAVAEPRPKLVSIVRHPIYCMLAIPVVCFIGVLLTDITYLKSDGNLRWSAGKPARLRQRRPASGFRHWRGT